MAEKIVEDKRKKSVISPNNFNMNVLKKKQSSQQQLPPQ